MRKVAALELAGDLQVFVVLMPSATGGPPQVLERQGRCSGCARFISSSSAERFIVKHENLAVQIPTEVLAELLISAMLGVIVKRLDLEPSG